MPSVYDCLNAGRLDDENLCPLECQHFVMGPIHHCARTLIRIAEDVGGLSTDEIAKCLDLKPQQVALIEARALIKSRDGARSFR